MPEQARYIYKILRAPEWEALQFNGETKGSPIDLTDGYIHFSTATQASETAAKHFADEAGLVVLQCEAARFAELKWEPSRGGALFPHLYTKLTLADVLRSGALSLGDAGHIFPNWVT